MAAAPTARVQYLGMAQGPDVNACSTIAEFMALYFCYSKAPTLEEIRQWLVFGETQWRAATKTPKQRHCELVNTAHARHPHLRVLLKRAEPEFIFGLSVREVLTSVSSFGGMPLERNVQSAFERIQALASQLPMHHSIGFTFCRGLYRIGGAARSVGNNAHVVFDLVDSHARVLKQTAWMPPPALPSGSAVWIRADNAKLLADVIEALYPPAKDDSDFGTDGHVMKVDERTVPLLGEDGARLGDFERQRLGEQGHLPKGFFEISIHVPRYETPKAASDVSKALVHAEPESIMAL